MVFRVGAGFKPCPYRRGIRLWEGSTLDGMTATTAQAGVCNVPNRTIFEGDNLDVMRGMNDGCVDLIYLDPPFNSNRDYAAMAVKLVEQRARNELGLMGGVQAIARSDIPKRTDREPAPPLSESKVVLYGTQGGNCNGCGTHFLPQHLTVDHIVAQSKGGTSHLDNLQLLWGCCNSLKGNRPMEYLRVGLVRCCVRGDFRDG